MHTQADAAICASQSDRKGKMTGSSDGTTTKSINVFESILANKGLSAAEKGKNRIAQEGFVVLVAGGETTARVLTTATYHLLANPETALLKLKEELTFIMPDPDTQVDVKTLEQLPWLVSPRFPHTGNSRDLLTRFTVQTAVVKESLRITALVTSRLPLVSPQEPLTYGDWAIPAGVSSCWLGILEKNS